MFQSKAKGRVGRAKGTIKEGRYQMSNWKACNSPLHEPILHIGPNCPMCTLTEEKTNAKIMDQCAVINYFQDACYTTEKQNFANELLDVFSEYLK
jgi:hypothetical protein|tara:strand:- start:135 stop:419 length:285 start_codon:yes stop_codon:yes gene_type:complete